MTKMLFATAPDGTRLPVIDITNPAFAAPESEAEIAALSAAALKEEESRGPVQRLLMGFFIRRLARTSRILAALRAANEGYLSGIATYVMKLGPDNVVPPYDSRIDKRVLETPIVTAMRVRLHQMARLLAEALAPELAGNARPLVLLEIAGGPSADALNALLLLEQQGVLAGRRSEIVIYDIDSEGPAFAASLLGALQGGPLAGRDIVLRHTIGDWSDRAALEAVLAEIPAGAVLAATSEGGLFEYGSDGDIVGVLTALAPRVGIITGSVTRDDRLVQLMRRVSAPPTVLRGLPRFGQVIAGTGYRVEICRSSPLSDQVLLTRS